MEIQAIDYSVDAQPYTGYFADGSKGQKVPGILVAHEGGGMTDHPKERAKKLAALGYVAFALDLFGPENQEFEQAKQEVQKLRGDRAMFRARMDAAFQILKSHPHVDARRLGAIGFCIGGMGVLELARSGADVAGVVGFHAALDTPTPIDARNISGKVLVCLGADDPIVDGPQRLAFANEMTAAGIDWQMLVFGGVGHSFTNTEIDSWGYPGFAYNARADRRSWLAMRDFFESLFGPD